MNTKQVIVMRTDLGMSAGKMCAQASHASMSFLTKGASIINDGRGEYYINCSYLKENVENEIEHWLKNSFRKITVAVSSEEELVAIHEKALTAGLVSHLVEDNGATVFNGVKTKTCCAIGPHWDTSFEEITDHLPLL